MIWKILDIEKTKDEETIKQAYRNKLRLVNPEDDAEGFKELRRAYEEAMDYAAQEEQADIHSDDSEMKFDKKKNEVDLWIDMVDLIYQDVRTRIDEEKWNTLLKDAVCDNLDTELEAAEKLLVYFMSHSYMPQNIWQLVDKRFDYTGNYVQLKEKFPENYLEYVKWRINKPNFIDFELFDGKTDKNVDEYISKLYEVKSVAEDKNLPKLKQLMKELKRFEVTHPFTETEEARCLLLEAELMLEESNSTMADRQSEEDNRAILSEEQEVKRKRLIESALSIMEDLDFEYSGNPYIERIYAEALIEHGDIDKARTVYESLLEENQENYSALLGKARCAFLAGNAEDAKEQIEEILEDRVQDAESLALLEKVNERLVGQYEAQLKEQFEREICFKLGWCYYQQKKFEKGIKLLDGLDGTEEYDYVNLRCRLYLANENYDKARPLADLWLRLIEESEEDGTKEMTRRKNRLSLAHFSIGVCIWEDSYKKAEVDNREFVMKEVVFYIRKAIEEETNFMVKMSYMEQLARFNLEAKNYKECIHICNEILEKDKGFFPAYVHRQKAHYELKNAKEVIDDYYSCIEIFPGYAPPYIYAAEVFYAFEQYDDVEQILEAAKAADIQSDSLELYRIRCIHYKEFSNKNVQRALKDILKLREKVLQDNSEDGTDIEDLSELERELAIIYWDLDDTKKAVQVINAFLETHPQSVSLLYLKADILIREKQYSEALTICKRIKEEEPNNVAAMLKMGNCYEYLEDIKNAVNSYKKILEINDEYAPALRRLMYIYSHMSNQENSLKLCKTAIQYATQLIDLTHTAEGYLERGNLYIDLYELDKAVEDCKQAIELDSEAYYDYNNLGCALLKLRRVEEAIEPLKKAIELDEKMDHLPYLNLVECYMLQKEYSKALDIYNRLIHFWPHFEFSTKKKIAKLYALKKEYGRAVDIYKILINNVNTELKQEGFRKRISKEPSDAEKKLMHLYCELADIYRQANDMEKAELYYNKVYSASRKMFKRCHANITELVAEYYRDTGRLEKALGVIEHTLKGRLVADEANTWDETHISFVHATILFELGRTAEAKLKAEYFIQELLKRYGGEEKMLSDLRYRPMYLYDIGIMHVCAGNLEKGKYYLERIKPCKLCVTCETCDCFEYYFGMGLIAELEGRKEEAKQFYQRAIELKSDYFCAKRHLDNLSGDKNA